MCKCVSYPAVYRARTALPLWVVYTGCCLSYSATWWRSRRSDSWPGCRGNRDRDPPAWPSMIALNCTAAQREPRTKPRACRKSTATASHQHTHLRNLTFMTRCAWKCCLWAISFFKFLFHLVYKKPNITSCNRYFVCVLNYSCADREWWEI